MNEKLQKLAQKIEENEELKAKLEELSQTKGNTSADYVALCQEYGIEITEEDLQPVPVELSEDELEAVTGGKYVEIDDYHADYVKCTCVAAGGGDGVIIDGTKYRPCACVAGGGGDPTFVRNVRVGDDLEIMGDPCFCVGYGWGKR